MLEMQHVAKVYRTDLVETHALRDLSLRVDEGEFIAEASSSEPELLVADVDLRRSEDVRRIWPFLRDRRVDAYGDLLKRFRD